MQQRFEFIEMSFSTSSPVSLQDADQDQSHLIDIAIGLSIGITTVAMILHLVARTLQNVSVGADDYTISLGAVSYSEHVSVVC